MTVKELKALIADLPDEMLVVYNYDSGHDYPTFQSGTVRPVGSDGENDIRVYASLSWPDNSYWRDENGVYRKGPLPPVFVLDEDEKPETGLGLVAPPSVQMTSGEIASVMGAWLDRSIFERWDTWPSK